MTIYYLLQETQCDWCNQTQYAAAHNTAAENSGEREKNHKTPNPTTSIPETGRKRKESDFHDRNPGTKKPRGEENTNSIFSLL